MMSDFETIFWIIFGSCILILDLIFLRILKIWNQGVIGISKTKKGKQREIYYI